MPMGSRTTAFSCCLALVLALTLTLGAQQPAAAPASAPAAPATQPQAAAQRRIHTLAYQAGYAAGQSDVHNRLPYDVRQQPLYASANQGYEPGGELSLQQYQANYREGFEAGYDDGYYGRREMPASKPGSPGATTMPPTASANTPAAATPAAPAAANTVPAGTALHLRLQNALSTSNSQANEPFSATVTQPVLNRNGQTVIPQGSVVLGHVGQVHAATGLSGESTMQLKFEQIRLPNGRTAQLRATVAKVGQQGSGVGNAVGNVVEGTPSANQEGQVQQSRTRGTVGNVAAGGAVGALLGAIIGGGKGAAIGTAAGAGLGAYLGSKRGPLNLPAGTPITIRLSEPVYMQ